VTIAIGCPHHAKASFMSHRRTTFLATPIYLPFSLSIKSIFSLTSDAFPKISLLPRVFSCNHSTRSVQVWSVSSCWSIVSMRGSINICQWPGLQAFRCLQIPSCVQETFAGSGAQLTHAIAYRYGISKVRMLDRDNVYPLGLSCWSIISALTLNRKSLIKAWFWRFLYIFAVKNTHIHQFIHVPTSKQ